MRAAVRASGQIFTLSPPVKSFYAPDVSAAARQCFGTS